MRGGGQARPSPRTTSPIPESQVTRGADVKATLAEVTTGDADVAVVYVTDAKTVTAAEGTSVSIPDAENVIAIYEIGQVKGTKNATWPRRGSPT